MKWEDITAHGHERKLLIADVHVLVGIAERAVGLVPSYTPEREPGTIADVQRGRMALKRLGVFR